MSAFDAVDGASYVIAGPGGPPYFPVPWAHDSSSSFLLTGEATLAELAKAGFRIVFFTDQTADALAQSRNRAGFCRRYSSRRSATTPRRSLDPQTASQVHCLGGTALCPIGLYVPPASSLRDRTLALGQDRLHGTRMFWRDTGMGRRCHSPRRVSVRCR